MNARPISYLVPTPALGRNSGCGGVCRILGVCLAVCLRSGIAQQTRIDRPSCSFSMERYAPSSVPELPPLLLDRSPFQVPLGRTPAERYTLVDGGGFRKTNGSMHGKVIMLGQSIVLVDDRPVVGLAAIHHDKFASTLRDNPITLRLGTLDFAAATGGRAKWLTEFSEVVATHYPGFTTYSCRDAELGVTVTLTATPALSCNGMLVEASCADTPDTALLWRCRAAKAGMEKPNYRVHCGAAPSGTPISGDSAFSTLTGVSGALQRTVSAGTTTHIAAVWGFVEHDRAAVASALARADRLDLPSARRLELKRAWLDNYLEKALDPTAKFELLVASAPEEFDRAIRFWRARVNTRRIDTPDDRLDRFFSWMAGAAKYQHHPPGLYASRVAPPGGWRHIHISVGWYGTESIGDHGALRENLLLYGGTHKNGYIIWPGTGLNQTTWGENQNNYWIDQLWNHYCWTADEQLVRDLWPTAKKIMDYELKRCDPDGDGLFLGFYEFWDCDSHKKGPKACAETSLALAALDRMQRMAGIVGDGEAQTRYANLYERTRRKLFGELWSTRRGVIATRDPLGTLCDVQPEAYEQFLGINRGLFSETQAYTMMRHVRANMWTSPKPGIHLQYMNNWWPVVWSHHYVANGDTCLAVKAACRAGLADEFYKVFKTIVDTVPTQSHADLSHGITNDGIMGGMMGLCDDTDAFLECVTTGLFGISPRMQDNTVEIRPAFPPHWQHASIVLPDVSYSLIKSESSIEIHVQTPVPRRHALAIGVRRAVRRVLLDGHECKYEMRPGCRRGYVVAASPAQRESRIDIVLEGSEVVAEYPRVVLLDEPFDVTVSNGLCLDVIDDQDAVHVVKHDRRVVTLRGKRQGKRTAFLKLTQGNVTFMEPIDLDVRPALDVPVHRFAMALPECKRGGQRSPSVNPAEGQLSFAVANNTGQSQRLEVAAQFLGEKMNTKVNVPSLSKAAAQMDVSPAALAKLLPGANPLRVHLRAAKRTAEVERKVIWWPDPVPFDSVPLGECEYEVDSRYSRDRYGPGNLRTEGGFWASADKPGPHWVIATLPDERSICGVQVNARVGGFVLVDYDVQVGEGDGWRTVAEVRENGRRSVVSTFAETRTPRVRVLIRRGTYTGKPRDIADVACVRALTARRLPATSSGVAWRFLDLSEHNNFDVNDSSSLRLQYDDGSTTGPLVHGRAPQVQGLELPEAFDSKQGVRFLVRQHDGRNAILLMNSGSSKWPTGVTIPIGRAIRKAYLLALTYCYPVKAYVPHAEILVHYADGSTQTKRLTPPYSFDPYYQHHAIENGKVPLFDVKSQSSWDVPALDLHLDVIDVCANPDRQVKSIEIRMTCTEAFMAIMGLTLAERKGS